MTNFYRGEVYYIEPYLTAGSEQRAGRPAIIVSNDMANSHSPVVEVVYLTTQPKADLPTHVTIQSTNRESTALCEQITSVSKDRIGSFICTLTQDELLRMGFALLTSLDLSPELVSVDNAVEIAPPLRQKQNATRRLWRSGTFIKSYMRTCLCESLGKDNCHA